MKLGLLFPLLFALGCSAAPPPAPVQATVTAQAMARGAVETAETVWMATAQGCLSLAEAEGDAGIPLAEKCKTILLPARDSLVAAAGVLDAYTDARQGEVSCAVQSAMGAVNQVVPLLQLPAASLSIVTDAQALANALGPCNKDGGK